MIAVAAAAGIGLWLGVRGSDSHTSTPPAPAGPTGSQIVPVTLQGLATLVTAVRRPIYWAGSRAGFRYELTRLANGRVYVRYLRAGMKIGDPRPALTVGTYPVADAFGDAERSAGRADSVRIPVSGGAVAFYSRSRPTNTYLAFPGGAYQIEVFDPNASEGHALVRAGKIVAVKAAGTGARIVSAAQLASLARSAAGPIYWVGPRSNVEYEVTKTVEGRTFVRYLPPGTRAGSNDTALTVGSYPVKGAFASVQQLSGRAGFVPVAVTGGAVAAYPKVAPTSVYLAFPGSDVQIEVYSPKRGEAASLVTAGKIVPIR